MNPFLGNILESFWVAKAGTRSKAARKKRYGKRMTRSKVGQWRGQQEGTAKQKQYEAAAHLMALSDGAPDHKPYLQQITGGLVGGSQFHWTNSRSKTKISVGNVNATGVPDVVIHKGGSSLPTSKLEIASGANKMWGSFNPQRGVPIQQQIPRGHLFHRLIAKGALTPQHIQAIDSAINSTKSPRVAHDTTVGKDGRHAIFKEVEAHLRSAGISHIMVGGQVFSTDHSSGAKNLSHVIRKVHFTTSGAGRTKRLALRISGLRDPGTGTAIKGNEENYNQVIADNKFGDHPSTLVV